jgi:hypothetical protein
MEGKPVFRLTAFLLLLACAVAACSGASTEPPPDPMALVTTAAENIRETNTFRMLVERTGAPYFILTDLGNVSFRRAMAQYVAPNVMQAQVRLIAAGLPTEVGVFSRGEEQWYRNDILTGGRWYNAPFSPGFNPQTLIAEETGFQQSLQALVGMTYVGEETLEDGSPVYHLDATANGEDVTALLAGLIEMGGTVEVDVYINRETRVPARFVIVQPDTVTEDEPEPTTWTIDVYDIDAPAEIDDPEADEIVPADVSNEAGS